MTIVVSTESLLVAKIIVEWLDFSASKFVRPLGRWVECHDGGRHDVQLRIEGQMDEMLLQIEHKFTLLKTPSASAKSAVAKKCFPRSDFGNVVHAFDTEWKAGSNSLR